MPRSYSLAKRAEVVSLHENGEPVRLIAEQLQCSERTVERIVALWRREKRLQKAEPPRHPIKRRAFTMYELHQLCQIVRRQPDITHAELARRASDHFKRYIIAGTIRRYMPLFRRCATDEQTQHIHAFIQSAPLYEGVQCGVGDVVHAEAEVVAGEQAGQSVEEKEKGDRVEDKPESDDIDQPLSKQQTSAVPTVRAVVGDIRMPRSMSLSDAACDKCHMSRQGGWPSCVDCFYNNYYWV